MNLFAWNITVSSNTVIPDLEYDYVVNEAVNGDKVIFVFWETEFETSKDLVEYFEDKLWSLKNYDLSIETEDNIEVWWDWYDDWVYELATFEWEHVNFDEILDRFQDVWEVVSVREAEDSDKFWNRVVKVDFVY